MWFKFSVSNSLIIVSIIITILAYFMPSLDVFWVNNIFLREWLYHIYFIQFFTWTFLHGWLMHILFNSFFLYIFWNTLELLIWKKKYIIFFLFVIIFNGILISNITDQNTIWISGFCMALLSYYTLELRSRNNPEYKWWVTALIINIWIWFIPWISLYWHLFWAVAGVLYYLFTKDFFRRKYIWAIDPEAT